MNRNLEFVAAIAVAITLCTVECAVAQTEETASAERGARYELWIGASNWQALGDLQPAGSFVDNGFALGGALHTPVHRFTGGDLLFGIDLSIASNDSSTRGRFGDLVARHLYVGFSTKYRTGAMRNLTLDAGAGYHLADIADVDSGYYGLVEDQVWESTAFGFFVGATVDFGRATLQQRSGWFFSMKAHFVDFGSVADDGTYFGPDAGTLDGPLYLLAIGYSFE